MKTLSILLNGKPHKARKFNEGERVRNKNGYVGTVLNTENNGLFVIVDWEEKNRLGKRWMVTSLDIDD